MNSSPPPTTAGKTSNPLLKWLFRLGMGLAVLALLLSRRDTMAQVQSALTLVPWWVLLASVGFYWLGQLLSVWRWRLLLGVRGIHLSYLECCRLYAAGMFGNLFLPTSIGGDALRAALLSRQVPQAPLPEAAASILIERIAGFVALLSIAAVAAIMAGAGRQAGPALWASLILLAMCAAGTLALRRLTGAREYRGVAAKLIRIWEALDFYLVPARRPALAAAVGLSLIFQISQLFLNAWLARRAGIMDVPVGAFFWICPLMSLAAMLPLGIGGLGVREAAAVGLLKAAGFSVAEGTAIVWSLLWQATVWLASLPGGLFLRGRHRP